MFVQLFLAFLNLYSGMHADGMHRLSDLRKTGHIASMAGTTLGRYLFVGSALAIVLFAGYGAGMFAERLGFDSESQALAFGVASTAALLMIDRK